MSRTFHELVDNALVDLARQARPVDLTDAALRDAGKGRRLLLASGVAVVVLATGTGALAMVTAQQPARTGPQPHPSASPSPSQPPVREGGADCTGADAPCTTPTTAPARPEPTERPRSADPPRAPKPSKSTDHPGNGNGRPPTPPGHN